MILNDYRRLLVGGAPMIDLRAPIEFSRGAFPSATNLPLLDDDERARVGTCYKRDGPDAAVALGHRIVSGHTLSERLQGWRDFCEENPGGVLYCFRGGQRSAIVQQWLAGEGINYPRVEGGYKAMRGFLLEELERLTSVPLVLVGGRTGVGKTDLMHSIPMALDLEGLANHRGSAFGRRVHGQPSQIDFENALVIEWLRSESPRFPVTVFEDESHLIGSVALPESLWRAFQKAPVVVVDEPLAERIARIRRDFVDSMLQEYRAEDEFDWSNFSDHLTNALDRIRKRLGGARHDRLRNEMLAALDHHRKTRDSSRHENWIRELLRDYYDPMYDYQLGRRQRNILFSGNLADVRKWLNSTLEGGLSHFG